MGGPASFVSAVVLPALRLAFLVLAGFAWGYQVRGHKADAQAIQATADTKAAELAQAQANAAQVMQNAMQAAADTRARLDELASHESTFKTLAQKVADYVRTHPDDDACRLGPDGLQVWREANAPGAAAAARRDQP